MLGLVGFALSVLPLLASAPAAEAAQPQAAPQPQSVQESAEVSLVEVPVRVLDRHGNPLRDLTEKDFEVFDDGKRQEIVAFDRIDLAQKAVETGAPAVIQPAARRHFLLLFDLSFAKPKAVVAARRAAKEFVLGLPPNDFASVATFSVEKGVRLLVTFSGDRVQLAQAIDTLGLTDVNSLGDDPLALRRLATRELGLITRGLRGCSLQLSPSFVSEPDDLREMTRRLRSAFDAAIEHGDVPASALATAAG